MESPWWYAIPVICLLFITGTIILKYLSVKGHRSYSKYVEAEHSGLRREIRGLNNRLSVSRDANEFVIELAERFMHPDYRARWRTEVLMRTGVAARDNRHMLDREAQSLVYGISRGSMSVHEATDALSQLAPYAGHDEVVDSVRRALRHSEVMPIIDLKILQPEPIPVKKLLNELKESKRSMFWDR